jgi:hypothetical protein
MDGSKKGRQEMETRNDVWPKTQDGIEPDNSASILKRKAALGKRVTEGRRLLNSDEKTALSASARISAPRCRPQFLPSPRGVRG